MNRIFLLGLALCFAAQSYGAETVIKSSTSTGPGKLIGGIDLRPTYNGGLAEFHTENSIQGGYQFTPDVSVFYRQEFSTNLYNPRIPQTDGMNLAATDGSLRTVVNNIWKQDDLAFSFEQRLYLPTMEAKRNAGMLASTRNYMRLRYRLNSLVNVVLDESPGFHIYDRAGSVNALGKAAANPGFENRTYLTAEISFTPNLRLNFPLKLSSARYRAFAANAKNNDAWAHSLYLNPELYYTVNSNVRVGMAYCGANMIQPDFSGFTLDKAFEFGLTQLIFQASI